MEEDDYDLVVDFTSPMTVTIDDRGGALDVDVISFGFPLDPFTISILPDWQGFRDENGQITFGSDGMFVSFSITERCYLTDPFGATYVVYVDVGTVQFLVDQALASQFPDVTEWGPSEYPWIYQIDITPLGPRVVVEDEWTYQFTGEIILQVQSLHIPSSGDFSVANRFLVTTDSPEGQRESEWGSDWLNIGSGGLFTGQSDAVDFNALTANQLELLDGDIYNALPGADTVTLPDLANLVLSETVAWDPQHIFDAGGGDDRVTGGDGADRIRGGDGDDIIDGRTGNDTIYDSIGLDTLSGGPGDDEFRITNGVAQSGGATSGDQGFDTIHFTGQPDQVSYSIQFGTNWETTTTTLTIAGAESTELTRTVEHIVFSDPTIDNGVTLTSGNVIAEMARLALHAYDDTASDAQTRGWRPLSAMELGLQAGNFTGAAGEYRFANGVFSVRTSDGLAMGNVQVLVGVVNGVPTLTLAFRGTDQLSDIQTYFPFSATYAYFEPLIEALRTYIDDYQIGQVLITGHSLGAAMAQTALGEDFSGSGGVRTFVFASPGSDVDAPDNLINVFNRSLDPVPALGDSLNDSAGPILTIAGNPTWAINPHSMATYLTEVQQLVSLAADESNSGFHSSYLGNALGAGALWTGESLQIRIGNDGSNNLVARDADNYILTGAGNDRILFTEGSVTAFVDAGAGTDLILLADIFGTYTRTAVTNGFEIFLSGESIGTFYGVEQFFSYSGPLWGGTVQTPDTSAAAVSQFAAEGTVFVLTPGFTAADAGDGDMTVIGTDDADVIYAGLGDKTIAAGDGDDLVIVRDGGNAAAGDAMTIDGGAGADMMIGGRGSETFIVDNIDDAVEDIGGVDLIRSSVSFVLPDSIENILLEGDAVGATGNDSNNMLTGNAASNYLAGAGGIDILTGGGGEDFFRDTAAGLNGDTITDFAVGDRIILTDADLANFTFSLSGSTLIYSGGSLTLSNAPSGTLVASGAAGGGVQLSFIPPPLARAALTLAAAGQDFTIGGDVLVYGTTAPGEVIELLHGNVRFDASFNTGGDTVVFPGNAGSYTAILAGSFVTVEGDGLTVAIPVGIAGLNVQFADSTRVLRFDTTTGQAMLGAQAISAVEVQIAAIGAPLNDPAETSPNSLGRLVLAEPGQDIEIGGNVAIFGSAASGEVITILAGTVVLDASFNAGGDTVVLPGTAEIYTATLAGSFVNFVGGGISVAIPVGVGGLSIAFADATRSLRFDTATGHVMLGDQAITGTQVVTGVPDTLVLDGDIHVSTNEDIIAGYETVILGTRRDEDSIDGHWYWLDLDNDNAPSIGTVLTIDASALAIVTESGTPLISERLILNASAVNAFNLLVIGGAARDYITIGQGNHQVSGGGGADQIYVADSLTSDDTIDGGAGTDFLHTSGPLEDSDFTNVSSIYMLYLDSPAVLGTEAAESGMQWIEDRSGGAVTIDLSDFDRAVDSWVEVEGLAGADTFILGGDPVYVAYEQMGGAASSIATGQDTVVNFRPGIDGIDAINVEAADHSGLHFVGNFATTEAAQAALIANDGWLDIVFDQSTQTVWFDLDDNGILDPTDLSVLLPGVTALEPDDVGHGLDHRPASIYLADDLPLAPPSPPAGI